MIKHIVLLALLPDHDPGELQEVMAGLDGLRGHIPGFDGFDHGANLDFEGMSPGCDYGFICHFAGRDTSQAYLVHADHAALGARLVRLCKGGAGGITVVDLEIGA